MMWQDKRIIVTGGANGIGRAIVEAFCKVGAKVAFCDTNKAAAQEVSLVTGAHFFQIDVCDESQLNSLWYSVVEQWGDVDILVNNVGVSRFSPITETSVDEFDQILSINLRPIFILSRLMALQRQKMLQNRYGRVINIASTRYLMSEPESEAYAASKGGIVSLTHALAISLSKYHITVNAVSPGWIETGDYSALRPKDHKQHPSGRVGHPSDIASMVIYLAHPEHDFITGQNFIIDGGMTKKMIYCE